MAKDIKIFMCTHKPYSFLPPLCTAVQGGAAERDRVPDTLSDDGAHGSISEKNKEYCELTVQYYAYKNEDADYYGFCHYRRFFSFKETDLPYLVFGKASDDKLREFTASESDILKALEENDVIVPRDENLGVSVYKKYVTSKHCYKEDIELFLSILCEKHPELSESADKYMSGTYQYFCNMFIMKRELFFEYSRILFELLSEFDRRKVIHGKFEDDRTDGYLGERFLGIYLTYLKSKGIKVKNCVRIDTECSLTKRITYKLFPPESKIRFFIKALFKINKNRKGDKDEKDFFTKHRNA